MGSAWENSDWSSNCKSQVSRQIHERELKNLGESAVETVARSRRSQSVCTLPAKFDRSTSFSHVFPMQVRTAEVEKASGFDWQLMSVSVAVSIVQNHLSCTNMLV
jgi:hypothetical protein